jgi:hypothetical protein
MDAAYGQIQTYWDHSMDLYALSEHLSDMETDPGMLKKLTRLRQLIDGAVLAEVHGAEVPGSRGMSVHCPRNEVKTYNQVEYTKTLFQQTQWGRLLQAYNRSGQAAQNWRMLIKGHNGKTPFGKSNT